MWLPSPFGSPFGSTTELGSGWTVALFMAASLWLLTKKSGWQVRAPEEGTWIHSDDTGGTECHFIPGITRRRVTAQCRLNGGPTSASLAHHWTGVGPAPRDASPFLSSAITSPFFPDRLCASSSRRLPDWMEAGAARHLDVTPFQVVMTIRSSRYIQLIAPK